MDIDGALLIRGWDYDDAADEDEDGALPLITCKSCRTYLYTSLMKGATL